MLNKKSHSDESVPPPPPHPFHLSSAKPATNTAIQNLMKLIKGILDGIGDPLGYYSYLASQIQAGINILNNETTLMVMMFARERIENFPTQQGYYLTVTMMIQRICSLHWAYFGRLATNQMQRLAHNNLMHALRLVLEVLQPILTGVRATMRVEYNRGIFSNMSYTYNYMRPILTAIFNSGLHSDTVALYFSLDDLLYLSMTRHFLVAAEERFRGDLTNREGLLMLEAICRFNRLLDTVNEINVNHIHPFPAIPICVERDEPDEVQSIEEDEVDIESDASFETPDREE